MALRKCTRCRGTGSASVARDEGKDHLPFMDRPFGIYQCPSCNGKGEVGFPDLSEEQIKKFREHLIGVLSGGH